MVREKKKKIFSFSVPPQRFSPPPPSEERGGKKKSIFAFTTRLGLFPRRSRVRQTPWSVFQDGPLGAAAPASRASARGRHPATRRSHSRKAPVPGPPLLTTAGASVPPASSRLTPLRGKDERGAGSPLFTSACPTALNQTRGRTLKEKKP